MTKPRGIAIALSLVLLATSTAAANAVTAGSACKIKGKQVTVAKVRYQCVTRNKKLVWVRITSALTPKATTRVPSFTGNITVFAASSLTESFNSIAADFQRVNPQAHVTLSFGGSSALATQIINGAPADVFASASNTNMQQVLDAKQTTNPVTFARNRLMIVTPPNNPANITSLSDLAKPSIKVAICQSQVPCGAVAKAVFANAKITVTPVTYEADAKSVLTKVLLGEVDAGLVYVTDARSAGTTVNAITIPSTLNAETTYPISLLRASANPATAKAFIDFVLSDRGAAALAAVGFTVL